MSTHNLIPLWWKNPLHCPDTSLGKMLDQSAQRFGSAPAMVYRASHWTYQDLRGQANRLAGGLASLGVRRGDRVMLTLPNCPEFVLSFFAVQKLGAVVVNAGPLMGSDDLVQLHKITTPKLIIALDLLGPKFDALDQADPNVQYLWVSLRGYQTFWRRVGYRAKLWKTQRQNGHLDHDPHLRDLLAQAPPRPPTVSPHPDDIALFQPTGGTSGQLKVARLSHRNLLANATQLSSALRPRLGQECFLGILPMFHVYGLSTCLITPLLNAACIAPITRFSIPRVLSVITNQRPSFLPLAPAILEPLCDALEHHRPSGILDTLRNATVTSGAAPLSAATAQRFFTLTGIKIIQGYGLTEASPVTHTNPPGATRDGSIGLALPGTLARVATLDDPDRDAPPGEAGELLVHGPQIMIGYLNDPQASAAALHLDRQGRTWLRTGDIVRRDADGYDHIIDRRKDMINRSGLKVYPQKVETVLKQHPHVTDAAVFGRADPVKTQIVVAAIVSSATDLPSLMDELKQQCRSHLAPYEVPECFEFVSQVPRTHLGKLQRARLRHPEAPTDLTTTSTSLAPRENA